MTEVIENQEQQEPEINELEVLKQQLADAQKLLADKDKSIEAINNKKNELLNETKAAKQERERQKAEALKVAEQNGEFEKLYKQEKERRESVEQERENDRKERRKDKIDAEAMKIAADLANNSKDAVLLKKFIAESIGNLADETGQVDGDVLKSVKQQFETDDLYSSLRKGNQSVGGSAPGNTRSAGSDKKQITMEEYNKLTPLKQLEFSKAAQAGKAQII